MREGREVEMKEVEERGDIRRLKEDGRIELSSGQKHQKEANAVIYTTNNVLVLCAYFIWRVNLWGL